MVVATKGDKSPNLSRIFQFSSFDEFLGVKKVSPRISERISIPTLHMSALLESESLKKLSTAELRILLLVLVLNDVDVDDDSAEIARVENLHSGAQ